MKRRSKAPFILGGALLALGLFSCGKNNITAKEGWTDVTIKDPKVGETVFIPDKLYTENGNTVVATKVTTFPDGSQVIGDDVTFSLPGKYTITYTAQGEDGKVHSTIETKFVEYSQLSVSNQASSVKVVTNPSQEGINADKGGVLVKLAYGDTLTFTKPVPISSLTSTNRLVDLYVVPSSLLSVDFSTLTLTLTNPKDANNYVKITYFSHVETNSDGSVSHSSSVCARSDAVNVYAGIHQSQGLHTNDKYGLWSGCTFDGYVQPSYKSDKLDNCMFTFGYDDTTKQTYGTGYEKGTKNELVLDLDNPDHVRKIWGGFNCDEVLMSITCDSYASSTANFMITNILGVDSKDLFDNHYEDETGPVITYDGEEYLPSGAKGYTYPIPSATAFDSISKECPVTIDVYQNYDDEPNRVKVKVENNTFKIDNSGLYAIVYRSFDHMGNKSELVKYVNVFSEIQKPTFDIPTHIDEYDVGSFVKLTAPQNIVSYCGDASYKMYYKSASMSEKEDCTDEKGFRITKNENYTVYYQVKDMIGQTTEKSYNITVKNDGKAILVNDLSLPKYFISDGYYTVSDLTCYVFKDNQLIEKTAEFSVTYDGKTTKYQAGEEYKTSVTNNKDTINVKLTYEGNTLVEENIVTIKGTELNESGKSKLKLENYFVLPKNSREMILRPNESIKVGDTERGAYFHSDGGAAIAADFANSLLGCDFSTIIKQVTNAKNKTTIKVTLTDAEDRNCSVSAYLTHISSKTYFVVGNKRIECLGNYFSSEDNCYPISFDGTSFCYNYDSSIQVEKTDQGDDFVGFKSNNVFMSVSASDCDTNTSFMIESICSNTFSSESTSDRFGPNVYMFHEIGGAALKDSVYLLPPVLAKDVLSPNITFTLTITDAKNNYAKDINGVEMNEVDPTKGYSILLNEYGKYTFELVAREDTRYMKYPNKTYLSRSVNVYDDVKPTITMQEQFQSQVKVGTEIRFPKFTYSDNFTATDKLVVQRVYLDGNGDYHYMTEKETSIKFEYKGTYKIMINVMDEYGNIANVTMKVNVIE